MDAMTLIIEKGVEVNMKNIWGRSCVDYLREDRNMAEKVLEKVNQPGRKSKLIE